MDQEVFGISPGESIPGSVVHDYLHRYAEEFDLYSRIRLKSKVETMEKRGADGWLVTVSQTSGDPNSTTLLARKLIVATGLTSDPFIPNLKGRKSFQVPLFHAKDFAQRSDTLNSAKSVVVFGGAKSGWDIAYAYASAGVKVHWVIRSSGHGPAWMSPSYVSPFKMWIEKLLHTRFLTWFSPSIWGDADGYPRIRRFLNGTKLGRALIRIFWWILGRDVIQLNRYNAHSETAKLKPWTPLFSTGATTSILNYPNNIFDFVRDGQIKVHISDITQLTPRTVHLSNGGHIETDLLVCCTGWKYCPPIKFLPAGFERSFGLPCYCAEPSKNVTDADSIILKKFPILKTQTHIHEKTQYAIMTKQSYPINLIDCIVS